MLTRWSLTLSTVLLLAGCDDFLNSLKGEDDPEVAAKSDDDKKDDKKEEKKDEKDDEKDEKDEKKSEKADKKAEKADGETGEAAADTDGEAAADTDGEAAADTDGETGDEAAEGGEAAAEGGEESAGDAKFGLVCKIHNGGKARKIPGKAASKWEGTIKCTVKLKSGTPSGAAVAEVSTTRKGKNLFAASGDVYDGSKAITFTGEIPQTANGKEAFPACKGFGIKANVKLKDGGKEIWKKTLAVKAECK